MKRIPEPELMLEPEQVKAYANADFDEPHSMFIEFFKKCFSVKMPSGNILDLGCGPGDITFRFAREFRNTKIDAVDGSEPMIGYAKKILNKRSEFIERIDFYRSMIEDFRPQRRYDFIISNSLLHHMNEPCKFWSAVAENSDSGTCVFIMDLVRPAEVADAANLVKMYASGEPEILKKDFFNSLIASFTPSEVRKQLQNAGITGFKVVAAGDRHQYIYGSF